MIARTVGAVYEAVNELESSNIPLLAEEGWMRGQKRSREATLFRVDGVVGSGDCKVSAVLTTPSAPTHGLRRFESVKSV
jgi:hypothetical protein